MSNLELLRQTIELVEQVEGGIDQMTDVPDKVYDALNRVKSWLETKLWKAEDERRKVAIDENLLQS